MLLIAFLVGILFLVTDFFRTDSIPEEKIGGDDSKEWKVEGWLIIARGKLKQVLFKSLSSLTLS
jgi:hypothetical protein